MALHDAWQPSALNVARILSPTSVYHHRGRACFWLRSVGWHFAGDPGHAVANRRGSQEERMNWLSQIASVTLFGLRTIPERKGAAFTAAVGIAGVVAVLVGV